MAGKLEDIQVRASGSSGSSRTTGSTRTKRDTPPRASTEEKKASATPPYRAGIIQAGMTRFYGMAGMFLMLISPETAIVVMRNAENLAKSWEILARSNPTIRKVLYQLIGGAGWGTVAAAHAPIFMVLAKQYGPARLAAAMKALIENNPGILVVQDIDLDATSDIENLLRGEDIAPPAAA